MNESYDVREKKKLAAEYPNTSRTHDYNLTSISENKFGFPF